jgi:ATP-dependent phosphofructokinase / diphosphate-dependent phosphofructokinase
MSTISRIGVLTGGGDAPGLNAVIRAVVKSAANANIECIGLEDSFDGLIEPGRSRVLTPRDVTGILRLGGTILGTTNRGNPFAYPVSTSEGTHDYSDRVVDRFHKMELGALVVIGGDGTLAIAHQFCQRGLPVVGVPKTIDNDIVGTTNCFGFDTAVAFATDAIDRLHTTAEAHHRIMIVEVMGRHAGWIALYAGVAGGADAILIPEIPFDISSVAHHLRERDKWGAKFSIVVVAEGAYPAGGTHSVVEKAHAGHVERLGGIGAQVCEDLAKATGKETRAVVLGHLQRGGAPTSFDRILATRFGGKAVELIRRGEFGTMVAFAPPDIIARRLDDIVGRTKRVPTDFDLISTARSLGVTFGDSKFEVKSLKSTLKDS